MNNNALGLVPPKGQTSTKSSNGDAELFSMIYIAEAKQETPNRVPARWATFDCKCIIKNLLRANSFPTIHFARKEL